MKSLETTGVANRRLSHGGEVENIILFSGGVGGTTSSRADRKKSKSSARELRRENSRLLDESMEEKEPARAPG